MSIMAFVKIGSRVKELRTRKLWTQERLAKEADLSPRQIVRIERDEVEPRFSTIGKIAEALDVEPSTFVDN
jgi:transcriptional regulator with XRE-family HTH domain